MAGWRFDGMLCEASSMDTGAMWECPLLIELTTVPESGRLSSLGSLRSVSSVAEAFSSVSVHWEDKAPALVLSPWEEKEQSVSPPPSPPMPSDRCQQEDVEGQELDSRFADCRGTKCSCKELNVVQRTNASCAAQAQILPSLPPSQ